MLFHSTLIFTLTSSLTSPLNVFQNATLTVTLVLSFYHVVCVCIHTRSTMMTKKKKMTSRHNRTQLKLSPPLPQPPTTASRRCYTTFCCCLLFKFFEFFLLFFLFLLDRPKKNELFVWFIFKRSEVLRSSSDLDWPRPLCAHSHTNTQTHSCYSLFLYINAYKYSNKILFVLYFRFLRIKKIYIHMHWVLYIAHETRNKELF